MVLELRSDLLNVEILHPVHKYNGMGIAHGDTGHTVFLAVHRDRRIHYSRSHRGLPSSFRYHRYLHRCQDRLSHVHLYQCYTPSVRGGPALHGKFQVFYFSGADDGDVFPVRQSLIIDVFCHAADTVATHLRAAAVRIVHLHLEIRFLCRIDEDHTVSADAEMPVT